MAVVAMESPARYQGFPLQSSIHLPPHLPTARMEMVRVTWDHVGKQPAQGLAFNTGSRDGAVLTAVEPQFISYPECPQGQTVPFALV